MKDEFKCELCNEKFVNDDSWTLDDKLKEAKDNGFGADLIKGDYASVCDDCYKLIVAHWLYPNEAR